MLGGNVDLAIPYLHVRCAARFYERILEVAPRLGPGEVVICSPDGSVPHIETFEIATVVWFGRPLHPLWTPRRVARLGLWILQQTGRFRAEGFLGRATRAAIFPAAEAGGPTAVAASEQIFRKSRRPTPEAIAAAPPLRLDT